MYIQWQLPSVHATDINNQKLDVNGEPNERASLKEKDLAELEKQKNRLIFSIYCGTKNIVQGT